MHHGLRRILASAAAATLAATAGGSTAGWAAPSIGPGVRPRSAAVAGSTRATAPVPARKSTAGTATRLGIRPAARARHPIPSRTAEPTTRPGATAPTPPTSAAPLTTTQDVQRPGGVGVDTPEPPTTAPLPHPDPGPDPGPRTEPEPGPGSEQEPEPAPEPDPEPRREGESDSGGPRHSPDPGHESGPESVREDTGHGHNGETAEPAAPVPEATTEIPAPDQAASQEHAPEGRPEPDVGESPPSDGAAGSPLAGVFAALPSTPDSQPTAAADAVATAFGLGPRAPTGRGEELGSPRALPLGRPPEPTDTAVTAALAAAFTAPTQGRSSTGATLIAAFAGL